MITGQKVWTSGTQRANMILVRCRTDLDAPKGPHRPPAASAARRVPGPEASVSKSSWSEHRRPFGQVALDLAGAASVVRPNGPGSATDDWQDVFLPRWAGTIDSGTSEIQRNIIGERALGLPKEPSAERRA